MMSDIKLLILDIDGTIAGASNDVTKIVKKAIQKVQSKGIKVGLATGRMYCSALRFHYSINAQLPIIAYNGALIKNPQDNQIYSYLPLPKNIARQLLEYYQQPQWHHQIEVHFYVNEQLYVQEITENTKEYCNRSGVEAIAVKDLHSLLNLDLTKVLALCHNRDLMRQLQQNLRKKYQPEDVYLTQSSPIYLEATHPDVNKGNGVKYLTENLFNLSAKNVMVIGDNFNDLGMIEYGGISIAMGNAPSEVKNKADWITKNVEENGVAIAIEKFLS